MIKTERLLLRRWWDLDTAAYVAINNDPKVMRYFPSLYTRQESEVQIKRFN